MTPEELFEEIRDYCRKNANEAIVKKYAWYFKEGYDAYGLTKEQLEKKVNDVLANEAVDIQLVLDVGRLLVKSGKYEETSFAMLLLQTFSHPFDVTCLCHIIKIISPFYVVFECIKEFHNNIYYTVLFSDKSLLIFFNSLVRTSFFCTIMPMSWFSKFLFLYISHVVSKINQFLYMVINYTVFIIQLI